MTKKATSKGGDLDWGILASSIGPRARLLANGLGNRSLSVSAPYGLPTGSLTVLAVIAANPGSSQTALARKAGMATSALVGVVDQLEAHGLAARDRSESDRRRNSLSVTPAGEKAMAELFTTVDAEEQPIREALGDKNLARLLELLDQAVAALAPRR